MIFISKHLQNHITKAHNIWNFEKSDHAMVKIEINISNEKIGPGIKRINTENLENETTLNECKKEIRRWLSQIPKHWNPHTTLEYTKVALRSVIGEYNTKGKCADRLHKLGLEKEL